MSSFTRIAASLTLFSLFSASVSRAANEFTVAWGASIAPYCNKAAELTESEAKVKAVPLLAAGMGSENILKAVDEGKVQLGISGNSWENALTLIKEKKLEIKNLAKIKTKELGKDRIIFLTYKGGPKELSKDQLKGVLTGAISNWKEVGGEDAAIQIVIPHNTPSTQKTISNAVLDGNEINQKGAKFMTGGDEMAKYVATTKGAIGFFSPLVNMGDANKVKHPDIVKPVTAFTIGEPSPNAQAYMKTLEKLLSK